MSLVHVAMCQHNTLGILPPLRPRARARVGGGDELITIANGRLRKFLDDGGSDGGGEGGGGGCTQGGRFTFTVRSIRSNSACIASIYRVSVRRRITAHIAPLRVYMYRTCPIRHGGNADSGR